MKPRTPGFWLIAILLAAVLVGCGDSPEMRFEKLLLNANKGDMVSQSKLGYHYASGTGVRKDMAEAVKWYRKAAEQGDAHAQYIMGRCYAKGIYTAKDDVQAAAWYRKAADQGNARAQIGLGGMLYLGSGVAKDQVEGYAYLNLGGITIKEVQYPLADIDKTLSSHQILAGQKRSKEIQKLIDINIAARKEADAKKAGK